MNSTRYVGLDVHKATIAVGVADLGMDPCSWGVVGNTPDQVRKLVGRLNHAEMVLSVAYEAGPTGYALHRQLTEMGIACQVVAPGLIPQAPNDRVKTDRRDAVKLARLHRSGDLVSIWVPGPEHEALRNLVRSRADAQAAMVRSKNQLTKFLLRLGLTCPHRAWTPAWFTWLKGLQLNELGNQLVLEDYRLAALAAQERVKTLEQLLNRAVTQSPLFPLVQGLQTFRGIQLITAATIVAEVGDFSRFPSASEFMSYTGLVPSEYSSGGHIQRGRITRCGNSLLRHVLVESAHHARHKPARSAELRRRQEGMPEELLALSWKTQGRLYRRFWALQGRIGNNRAKVAVARELAGFIWQAGQLLAQPQVTLIGKVSQSPAAVV
jgi:transposase